MLKISDRWGSSHAPWLHWVVSVLIVLVGGGVAVFERTQLETSQAAEKSQKFAELSNKIVTDVTTVMQTYEYGLRGARGALIVGGPNGITRQKFRNYFNSREFEREFPGALGFGFIRRVPSGQEASFVASARADDFPAFQIRQLTPHKGDKLVIQYIEPVADNRQAVGLDIASEANRMRGAQAAMASGQPTLSDPITLVQASGKPQRGFLFALPVYRDDAPLETSQQRTEAAWGLVYAPLVIDDVLALPYFHKAAFSMSLRDDNGPSPSAGQALAFYASDDWDAPASEGLTRRVPMSLYGQQWVLEMKARPTFISNLKHLNPQNVAAEIFAVSVLLALLAFFAMQTMRHRRQQALEHSKLAAIVESSSDAIVSKDLSGVVTSWNKAAENIFGYTALEAIGQRLAELIVPIELWHEEEEILATISQGGAVNRTTFRRKKDGELLHASVAISPIFDSNHQVVGAAKTVRDVSKEFRMDQQFQLAINSVGIGVWIWQFESQRLYWDDRMYELYGAAKPADDSGHPYEFWISRLHPDDVAEAERKLAQLVAGEGPFDPVFRITCGDASLRWIKATALMERDFSGKPIQMVGTNIDITDQELVKAQLVELNASLEQQVADRTQELTEAVTEAKRANEAKSSFLANMSHEIRTPMNGVLGLAYLLSKAELPSDALQLVHKLQVSGRTLQRILDYSKLEAEGMTLEVVEFSIQDVIDGISVMMEASAANKNLELAIVPPACGVSHLMGDQVRLSQVLMNLVVNAVKFTERGFVAIRVVCLAKSETSVTLRFEVQDSGIGMTDEQVAKLFVPFQQADVSTTRKYGGTGLGLAISKQLLEKMGSTLQVQSEFGHGSRFFFDVELQRGNTRSQMALELKELDVVIADDSEVSRDALRATAESLGWHAKVVNSGAAAVKQVTQLTERPPLQQVIILDWQMPEMDGLEAAQRIHEQMSGEQGPIIIVVATAFSRDELVGHPSIRYTDAVLSKPVTASTLFDAVGAAYRRRKGFKVRQPVAKGQNLKGLRLLVVDDSEVNREVALRIFEGEGARVVLAEDGQQAFDWLIGHPQEVDVVLMDIQMPVLDGYGAMALINQQPCLSHIPVVALTAGVLDSSRHAVYACGMVGHIAKPMNVPAALAMILKVTGKGEPGAVPQRAVVVAVADLPGLAIGQALSIWGDEAKFQNYLGRFAALYEPELNQLHRMPGPQLKTVAHKLTGAAGNLGLQDISNAAAELERIEPGSEGVQQALARLIQAFEVGLSSIRAYLDSAPAVEAPPVTALDMNAVTPLVKQAHAALDSRSPDIIEPLLLQLKALLTQEDSSKWLNNVLDAIEGFDFRAARLALRQLAGELKIELESNNDDH